MQEIEEDIIKKKEEQSERELLLSTRSDEVQEIVGRMPSWIIRYGISLLAFIVIGIFIASYFIKYPDVLSSQVIITSSQPPIKIVSPTHGNIQKLFVSDHQVAHANEPLFLIKNSTHYATIKSVIAEIRKADSFLSPGQIVLHLPKGNTKNLGELQQAYNQLQLAANDYHFFANLDNHTHQVQHLQSQITQYQKLNQQILQQGKKLNEQRRIAQKDFEIDSSLVANGVMTELEYRAAKMKLLNQDINSGTARTQRIQNKLQQDGLRKAINETKEERQIRMFELGKRVKEQVQNFISQYQLWEEKYVVKSPMEGEVNFFSVWRENQLIQAGQGIMMITPEIRDIQARGFVGLNGVGKIKKGQKVLIKLRAYPYQEFGMLKGEIHSLSPVAMDSVYVIDVRLLTGLKTISGKAIPERAQLAGIGEIITSDKSILDRLFEKVKLQTN